jgi:gliding motility-associated-like protein
MKHFVLTLVLLFWGMSVFSQIDVTQNISCHDGNDGELTVTTTLINTPYTYVWSRNGIPIPSQTQKVAAGLDAALYSVTVTDASLATETFTYTLENPPAITAAYAIVPNSNWPLPNGRITITAGGGTGWFTYNLIDSTTTIETIQTANVFDNLYSGTYFITLTDINGCQRNDTVVVNELSGITTTYEIDSTACYDATAPISDVRPILVPANLPAQVQFPEDTVTIVELLPGPLYVTSVADTVASFSSEVYPGRNIFKVVTNDNKGFRHSWLVDSVLTPIKISYTQRNILCYGDNTGRINAVAEGSYSGFVYTITGPSGFSSNNAAVTDLFAGRYTIHVEDSTGCALDQSVIIKEPDAPIQGELIKKDLTCFQSNDGSITANFSGGTGQLSYSWDSGQTTASLSGLAAGTYTLTVTDENGCTLIPPSVTINEPARLHVTDVVVPVGCYGYTNASITTTVIGGNGGNSFVWKKDGVVMNNNTNAITNLSSGIYDLHLKDSVGCVFDTTWTLTNPANFQFEFVNTLISCNDELGIIRVHNLEAFPLDITVGGVTQNVLFDDTTSFADMPIGDHLVSISNGICTFDTTITFVQPEPLSLYVHTSDNVCYNGNSGQIRVEVRGGTSGANSTCVMAGPGGFIVNFAIPSRSFFAVGLRAGTYEITVTDDNGCIASQSTTITQPDAPRAYFRVENTSCPECEDGKALVQYVDHFTPPHTYLWSGIPIQTTQEADSLAAGWHYMQITDNNGCVTTDSVEIMAGNGVAIPNLVTPNGDGHNDVLDVGSLCNNASSIVLVIQNKDGEIFTSTDPSQTIWDAKNKNGNLVASGSLVYLYLKVVKQDGSEKPYRKTITILY